MATVDDVKFLLGQLDSDRKRVADAVRQTQAARFNQQQLQLSAARSGLVQGDQGFEFAGPGDPLFESQQGAAEARLRSAIDLEFGPLGQQKAEGERKRKAEDIKSRTEAKAEATLAADEKAFQARLNRLKSPEAKEAAQAEFELNKEKLRLQKQAELDIKKEFGEQELDIQGDLAGKALEQEFELKKNRILQQAKLLDSLFKSNISKGIDATVAEIVSDPNMSPAEKDLRVNDFGEAVDSLRHFDGLDSSEATAFMNMVSAGDPSAKAFFDTLRAQQGAGKRTDIALQDRFPKALAERNFNAALIVDASQSDDDVTEELDSLIIDEKLFNIAQDFVDDSVANRINPNRAMKGFLKQFRKLINDAEFVEEGEFIRDDDVMQALSRIKRFLKDIEKIGISKARDKARRELLIEKEKGLFGISGLGLGAISAKKKRILREKEERKPKSGGVVVTDKA